MKRMLMLIVAGAGLLAAGCATVPIVVPQALIEARAALGMAQKAQAPMLVPQEFQLAQRLLAQAESAFAAEQSIGTVEEVAFEAKADAMIAEADARRITAQQEYEQVQQALIAQQSMLMALTQKEAALKAAVQQLQQSAVEKKAAEDKAAAEAQKAEEEARKRAEAERLLKEQKEREARLLAEAQKIKDAQVKMEARGLVINLSGKVLFDTGSSKLQRGAMAALDQVAKVLKDFPGYVVKIEGHTDSTGDLLTNNTLSQARAESVLTYLNQQGVPLDILTAVGMGPNRPVATNNSPEGRQLNRRVEIVLEKIKEVKKTE